MPKVATATSTTALYENLGRGIVALTTPLSAKAGTTGITYQDLIDLGKQIDGLIKAATKSAVPGRQSDKQVKAMQQQARQSFARSLARKVKALG